MKQYVIANARITAWKLQELDYATWSIVRQQYTTTPDKQNSGCEIVDIFLISPQIKLL